MSSRDEYRYAEYVRRAVDAAPPLSPEQRAKLAILLRPTPKAGAIAVPEEEQG